MRLQPSNFIGIFVFILSAFTKPTVIKFQLGAEWKFLHEKKN